MEELRDEYETDDAPIVISGCIGPQDDGYSPPTILSADEAQDYHSTQIATFADTAADMVTAITMTYADEAIGIARAAQEAGLPVADLVHGRDRRPPAERPGAGRGDRAGRRADGRRAGLLHAQLRAPHALRGGARGGEPGASGSAACAPTPRPRATPSSTRRRSSTRATRPTSAPATRRYGTTCRGSTCSAAAAAPIIATSPRSATPGSLPMPQPHADIEGLLRTGSTRSRHASQRSPSRPSRRGDRVRQAHRRRHERGDQPAQRIGSETACS